MRVLTTSSRAHAHSRCCLIPHPMFSATCSFTFAPCSYPRQPGPTQYFGELSGPGLCKLWDLYSFPASLPSPSLQLEQIRRDIRDFRSRAGLDKVIVLWTANTERFCEVVPGLNDTAENLLHTIKVGTCQVE